MTAQIAESLLYEGKKVTICTTPLSDYFALGGGHPNFDDFHCTALWRGYVGSWEIVENRLYLIGLQGTLEDGSKATLATIFPDYPERVFAHWFSGPIRIPQGKLLKYVHMGYKSVYERDLFLELERGVLVNKHIRKNGNSQNGSSSEGYGVGGMTVSPRTVQSKEKEL